MARSTPDPRSAKGAVPEGSTVTGSPLLSAAIHRGWKEPPQGGELPPQGGKPSLVLSKHRPAA